MDLEGAKAPTVEQGITRPTEITQQAAEKAVALTVGDWCDRQQQQEQGGGGGGRSRRSLLRMAQEVEKVALTALAAVLVLLAIGELAVTVPVLLRRGGRAGVSKEGYPVRFLVVGDWGRDGGWNQSRVAAAMALKAETFQPQFIVSTGDNFYEEGLVSEEDPQFDISFREVYSQPSLQVPWHVVLGNHDFGEVWNASITSPPPERCGSAPSGGCFFSPLHQLSVRLAQRDPRWHCERSFHMAVAGGAVELFFIDTTPIIERYRNLTATPWAANRGGVLEQSWQDQLSELESRLARSAAEWKLVFGHHPIRTNNLKELGYAEMEERVEPLLIKWGAQAYFCGHDHNLQYIHNEERGFHEIVSGAGSQTYGDFKSTADSPFQFGGNGFVAASVGRESMRLEFLGVEGPEPLFAVEVPRHSGS